jgi:hypothetical protein
VEFDLGRKTTESREAINYFNQLVRSAGQANAGYSKYLFHKDRGREKVCETNHKRKNHKATHIAEIQTDNHFRPQTYFSGCFWRQLTLLNGRQRAHPKDATFGDGKIAATA